MKRMRKRVFSFVLAILMVLSLFNNGYIPGRVTASEQTQVAAASDHVTLVTGDESLDMKLYKGGLYETSLELSQGEHTYTVARNGNVEAEVSLTLEEAQTVYVRFDSLNSIVSDSVNNEDNFKASAVWVGNIDALSDTYTFWNPSDDSGNADLVYQGGGIYKGTFEFEALEADYSIEYKVAYGYAWSNGEIGYNVAVTIPAGSTEISIYADYLNNVCTDSINTPDAFKTVSIIGTVRCAGDYNWAPTLTGYDFYNVSENLYAYTQQFDAGEYEYKCVFDHDNNWYDGSNIALSVDEAETVVFVYNAEQGKLYDSINNSAYIEEIFGFPESETEEAVQAAVSDKVYVYANDTRYVMNEYLNGIYETEITADKYTIAVNGTEVSTVEISADSSVFVRYDALSGKVYDSYNNPAKFKTYAAWTGSLGAIDAEVFANWDPTDSNSNAGLDYVGGGIFAKTFTFTALENDTEIEYKVAYNKSWSNGEVSGNVKTVIPAGSTEITIYADYLRGVCTDTITSPLIGKTVSIIGTVREDDSINWSPNNTEYDFRQISENIYAYSKVFNAGTYEYKCVFDHTDNWYGGSNIVVNVTEDGTKVVFIYNAEDGTLYDSVNNYTYVSELFSYEVPVTDKIVLNDNGTASFFLSEEKEDAEVSVTYLLVNNGEVISENTLKMSPVYASNGNFNKGFVLNNAELIEDECDILYYFTVDGVRKTDVNNAQITEFNGEEYLLCHKDGFNGRDVYVPGTFPGAGSWNEKTNKMTYLGNDLYSYTFENVPAANYEYKIAIGGTWTENYGDKGVPGGGNISVSVPYTTDVTIYYCDVSHLSVNSLTYIFADIYLSGSGIAEGTMLKDNMLTGVYSIEVMLTAGTYSDVVITYDGEVYNVSEFTISEDRAVTFYFDPATKLYYSNASDSLINGENIFYDTKDTDYKSVYGAVRQNENVTFSVKTGTDVTEVIMFVNGPENSRIPMEKTECEDGYLYTADASFTSIGEYTYFFAISNGSDVKVYSDTDGYYGAGGISELNKVSPYDLVVYEEDFETPDWMKNAVIYQIFPDRFYNGDESNDQALTESRGDTDYEFPEWDLLPENPEQEELLAGTDLYPENAFAGDGNWSNEMYGGDLEGITEKLDYLDALGVTVIYINPVFQSISSHRYDATDYMKIDPILGDLGDFTELVNECDARDMHIVLDGVFNHVSDDSVYFDRYYKYVGENGLVGAYPYWAYIYDQMNENNATLEDAKVMAKSYFDSLGVTDYTYVNWFDIKNVAAEYTDTIGDRAGKTVYTYDCWWGYDSMPVIIATNGSEYQTEGWADFAIDGEGSVTQYWLEQGSDGWRLDVANEVSDETWIKFRESVKSLSSDNVIIGEIWDDATTYLLGNMYDSVMNYVFRNAVLGYVKGDLTSAEAMADLEKLRERYPEEAFYAMMNLVGSHDTTRLLSYLDGIADDRSDKSLEAAFPSYETTSEQAKQMQYLTALIQMTYPGAPTIYYGDEIGMTGADDPDNRRAMEWANGNKELVEFYAFTANMRNTYSALRTGSFEVIETSDNTNSLAYLRSDDESNIIVVTNNSSEAIEVQLFTDESLYGNYTDILNNADVVISENSTVTVPAYSGVVLTDNEKEINVDYSELRCAYEEVDDEEPEVPEDPEDPEEPEQPSIIEVIAEVISKVIKSIINIIKHFWRP